MDRPYPMIARRPIVSSLLSTAPTFTTSRTASTRCWAAIQRFIARHAFSWDGLINALSEAGVRATERDLIEAPLTIELAPEVQAELDRL